MPEIRRTAVFDRWLARLKDPVAQANILVRIDRLAVGNPGDVRPVGGGIGELRIDHGPGYRVYFVQRGPLFVVLLCGGSKRTQEKDIARAKQLAGELED